LKLAADVDAVTAPRASAQFVAMLERLADMLRDQNTGRVRNDTGVYAVDYYVLDIGTIRRSDGRLLIYKGRKNRTPKKGCNAAVRSRQSGPHAIGNPSNEAWHGRGAGQRCRWKWAIIIQVYPNPDARAKAPETTPERWAVELSPGSRNGQLMRLCRRPPAPTLLKWKCAVC
jgi:hypothetical protein